MKVTLALLGLIGFVWATPQGGLPAKSGNYASGFTGGESGNLPAAQAVKTYEDCQNVMRMAKEYSYAAICPQFPKSTAGRDTNAEFESLLAGKTNGSLPAAKEVQTYEECQAIMRAAKEYQYNAICPKFPKATAT